MAEQQQYERRRSNYQILRTVNTGGQLNPGEEAHVRQRPAIAARALRPEDACVPNGSDGPSGLILC